MKAWQIVVAILVLVVAVGLWTVGCSPKVEQEPTPATTGPAKTLPHSGAEPTASATDYTYTCPMHPEVSQARPGKCPECGMFLEADTDQAVEYYCPMHEDVVQDRPGKCPDCGMYLQARPTPQ